MLHDVNTLSFSDTADFARFYHNVKMYITVSKNCTYYFILHVKYTCMLLVHNNESVIWPLQLVLYAFVI